MQKRELFNLAVEATHDRIRFELNELRTDIVRHKS